MPSPNFQQLGKSLWRLAKDAANPKSRNYFKNAIGVAGGAYAMGRKRANTGVSVASSRSAMSTSTRRTNRSSPPLYSRSAPRVRARSLSLPARLPARRAARKFRGAPDSKSAGFFADPSTKVKSKPVTDAQAKGIIVNMESGGTASTTRCQFIGHAPLPYILTTQVIAKAMAKSLCIMKKTFFTDETERWHDAETRVDLYYTEQPTASESLYQSNFAFNATVQDVSNWLNDRFFLIFGDNSQAVLTRINVTELPSGSVVIRLPLSESKVTIWSKSTLKIQNRSKIGNDENADDVDNVPLYGKVYGGKGNGTKHIKYGETTDMFADSRGIIKFDGTNENHLQEPPNGPEFTDVKTVGKAHLDPGQIKTSVATGSYKGKLNKVLPAIIPCQSPFTAVLNPKMTVGTFKLYAMEKMIETTSVIESIIPLNIAYEHNLRIGAYFTVVTPKFQTTVNLFT